MTPLQNRFDPFENFGQPRPVDEDAWQLAVFLVCAMSTEAGRWGRISAEVSVNPIGAWRPATQEV
jgi:hypothetical protein